MTKSNASRNVLFFIGIVTTLALMAVVAASRAQGAGEPLLITEVAWMGNTTSPDDEFIELYNAGDVAINLVGFSVSAEDGTPRVVISEDSCANTEISAGGYFLLERTDDESVPGISADCIYVGSLENGGETLSILDSASSSVFTLPTSAGWPAGNNTTKLTMQWDGSQWVSATGTPRAGILVGGHIFGLVFHDVNENKILDDGETGMSGKALLYQYPNAPWKEGAESESIAEIETLTDGTFSFENIPAGAYQVFLEERAGWRTQTLKRYNILPETLSRMEKAVVAMQQDITGQMLIGCALRTTPCSKELHQELLGLRYFNVKVGEGSTVSGLFFANMAL